MMNISMPVFFLPAVVVALAPAQAAIPTTGAHTLSFYKVNDGAPASGITTNPINTQATGSTILALVARQKLTDFTAATIPIDNKGNGPATQIGSTHAYSRWPGSGEALYAWESAVGGNGHTFNAPMPHLNDEITLAAMEVKNGGKIQDYAWNEVLRTPPALTTSPPHTSLNVTTTGSATLVAIWLGDDGGTTVTATPAAGSGFTVTDQVLISFNAIETVVATKDVSAAGTYNITWDATPVQGTHLWLVAVQNVPEPSTLGLLGLGASGLLRRRR
jgi:hypothetical protein